MLVSAGEKCVLEVEVESSLNRNGDPSLDQSWDPSLDLSWDPKLN